MKKLLSLLLVLLIVLGVTGCAANTKEPATAEMNVYVLSGPTGIGAVNLRAKSEEGKTLNKYNFKMVAANDEIVAAVSKGEADIAAVATNLAATLYNKTNGGISILAVNTLGVLNVVTPKGVEIKSLAELKGKKIYTTGQGSNPEFIINYLLEKNNIDKTKDLTLEFKAEGRIMGTAAQMFSIAGPVIVFGCSAAALYGVTYYFVKG